jgi:hypothetical protein
MRGMLRWILVGLLVMGGLCGGAAVAHTGLWLGGPHRLSRPSARLAPALWTRISADLATADVRTVEQAIAFSLQVTTRQLHFGLGHRTSLAFGTAEREGHCVEYAHLFAQVLERVARSRRLELDAYVAHSPRARLFGYRLPVRGFEDHDWVLVVDRCTGKRHFLDPSFDDMGLGADIRSSVEPPVMVPGQRAGAGAGSAARPSSCRSASRPAR